jgi:hypothetical protein
MRQCRPRPARSDRSIAGNLTRTHHTSLVIAREATPTVAIQLEFQMDCFVDTPVAMTDRECDCGRV